MCGGAAALDALFGEAFEGILRKIVLLGVTFSDMDWLGKSIILSMVAAVVYLCNQTKSDDK